MKKLVILSIVIVAFGLLMTACYPAILDTTMTVNTDGSGTRVFVVQLLKDGTPSPDAPEDPSKNVVGMFTDPGYFPQGVQPALDYINANKPAEVSEVTVVEETDRYVFTYSMDFDSIEDLNAKMLVLSTNLDWAASEVAEATLTAVMDGANTVYTYTEDIAFVNIGALWLSTTLWDSPQDETMIFSVAYAQGQFNWEKHFNDNTNFQYAMFFTHETVLNLGTESVTFGEDEGPVTISFTSVPATATATPIPATPTTAENPETSDTSSTVYFMAVVFAAVAATTILIRNKASVK